MNPRESALSRPLALRLAATEYDRCTELFRSLPPGQWTAPTDCPAWDVRQMAAHMLGMVEMAASIRESLRQQRKAARPARSARRPRAALGSRPGQMPGGAAVPRIAVLRPRPLPLRPAGR